MSILGTALSSAVGIGSSIYGGIQSSRAAKRANALLAQEKNDNQNWYDRKYNEDGTQTASAQNMINQTRQAIKDRANRAAGTQAVMGGTDESTAQTKEADNDLMAKTVGTVAANADAKKDNIESTYIQNKQNLTNQQVGVQNQQAQNITNATTGVLSAAGGIAGASLNSDTSKNIKTPKSNAITEQDELN